MPRLLTPKTLPIPLLVTPTSRAYSHIHTLLVLGCYMLRFRALVADPLNTLIADLFPIALAQFTFCVLCLPSAGTWEGGKAIVEQSTGESKTGIGTGTGSMRRKGKVTGASPGGGQKSSAVPNLKSRVLVCRRPSRRAIFLS